MGRVYRSPKYASQSLKYSNENCGIVDFDGSRSMLISLVFVRSICIWLSSLACGLLCLLIRNRQFLVMYMSLSKWQGVANATYIFWYAWFFGLRISLRTLASNTSTSSFFHYVLSVSVREICETKGITYAKMVGEQVHCPAFHAIFPCHAIVRPNLFESWVLRPWSYGPFEGLVLDINKSSLLHIFLKMFSDAERFSKYFATLYSHVAPFFQKTTCNRAIITRRMDANFRLFKICAWFQSLVYLGI